MRIFRDLIVLMFVTLSVTSAYATIHVVPTNYQTIQSALSASLANDTILLQLGTYVESVVVPHSLTVCSNFLLTGDSGYIRQTVWKPATQRQIIASNLSLTLSGIRFVAPLVPIDSGQILDVVHTQMTMSWCQVEGLHTTTRNFSQGLFELSDTSTTIVNDCRFYGDSVAAKPLIRCDSVSVYRCSFYGRTNSTQYQQLFAVIDAYKYVSVYDSYFDIRGNGIRGTTFHIEQTRFVRGNQALLRFGGNTIGDRVFENCTFDSLESVGEFPIFWLSHLVDSVVFNRCTFTNTTGNGSTSIMNSYSPVVLRNCTFTNNQGLTSLIEGNLINIRQSRFYDNNTTILQRQDLSATDVYIETSDFVRNPALCLNAQLFDTVAAPDCYWGHPTGPNHVLNPGGQGMALPNYVRPFPFRTTPVFPDVSAPEPIIETGVVLPQPFQFSLYPNPTNGSATIRFSLPPTSPVTGVLFDRTGRQVSTFSLDNVNRSNVVYPLSLVNTPSGMYFLHLTTYHRSNVQPLILLK